MPSPAIPIRQVRDLGDVLNVTFQFMRQNARSLSKSLLFILGPPVFLCLAGFTLLMLGVNAEPSDNGGDALMVLWGFLLLVLAGIPLHVLPSAVTNSFLVLYQDAGPGNFDVRDVWLTVRRVFWRVLGAAVGMGVLGMALSFAAVIPCLGLIAYLGGVVYLTTTFTLAYPMLVREDIGVIDALRRCPALIKEHWWETFGVLFVANVLYYLVLSVAFMPTMVVFLVANWHAVDLEGNVPVILAGLGALGFLVLVLLRVVPELAVAFQYYSLVERKERIGLMSRIERMESTEDSLPRPSPKASAGKGGLL